MKDALWYSQGVTDITAAQEDSSMTRRVEPERTKAQGSHDLREFEGNREPLPKLPLYDSAFCSDVTII